MTEPKAKRSRKATTAQARRAAKPRQRTRLKAEPTTTAIEADQARRCKEGKHPLSRRIGTGCSACGNASAWPTKR